MEVCFWRLKSGKQFSFVGKDNGARHQRICLSDSICIILEISLKISSSVIPLILRESLHVYNLG